MVDLFKAINSSPQDRLGKAYLPLKRSLKRHQGFGIVFVRCTPVQINPLIEKIKTDIPEKNVDILNLSHSIDNLYDLVEQTYKNNLPDILFISGIEKSLEDYIKPGIKGQGDYYKLDTVPPLLAHLNWQRERFRDNFPICFVFLVPSFVLKYFVRRAPDFFDWRSGVFELKTEQKLMTQEIQRILSEGHLKQYQAWTPQQRHQKILEIKEIIQELSKTNPTQANLWLKIGKLFVEDQEYDKAIHSFEQALEFKPDDYYTLSNKGIALKNLGRLEEAIHSCDKALEFKPDFYLAWVQRGYNLVNLGRLEEAIHSCDKALEFKPDFYLAWSLRGIALFKLGRLEEAIHSYDKALEFKPDFYLAWNLRGIALRNLGQLEEAIHSYDKALEFKLNDDTVWCNRGNALRNLGRLEEAIHSFDKTLELNPNDDHALYNKAGLYVLQNEVELAIENLQQAINLDGKYKDIAKMDSDFDLIRSDPRFQALLS